MEKEKLKSVLTLIVFISMLGGFFALNRAVSQPETSASERRKLATWPTLNGKTLVSGEFMSGFEDFAADSFAFREYFREIRARTVFDIFRQTDKDGLYYDDAVGAGKFVPTDGAAVAQSAQKIQKVADSLGGLDMNFYFSLIPDKDLYASKNYPGSDIGLVWDIVDGNLQDMTLIDLAAVLTAADYYRTDLHWRQQSLSGVVEAMGSAMDFSPVDLSAYTQNSLGDFYGVYAGQLALPVLPDEMIYLTGGALDGAVVSYLNVKTQLMEQGEMYPAGRFGGGDPYDIFLGGPQPLVVIENPAADSDKELFLFRDSFSSSLAPLLAQSYARVTLIDLRYIDSRILPQFVAFTQGSDVLFLYSAQILNSPETLLVH